jgi:hypothetical protein
MSAAPHLTPPVLAVDVLGVGLLGPGLVDWASAQALLREPALWCSAATVLPPPSRLPPAERRRSGAIVKLSLAVADQACAMAGEAVNPGRLATVFSSSSGDPANTHALCEALAMPERLVSPTRFTNSVHNATAGYWHIATQSRAASTSLCGFDASFGAGLLEAVSQCLSAGAPVLLVASDVPYPEPLLALRATAEAFALALLIAPAAGAGQLRLSLLPRPTGQGLSACEGEGLEALRAAVPSARGLPLLQALARGQGGTLWLAGFDALSLRLELKPGATA